MVARCWEVNLDSVISASLLKSQCLCCECVGAPHTAVAQLPTHLPTYLRTYKSKVESLVGRHSMDNCQDHQFPQHHPCLPLCSQYALIQPRVVWCSCLSSLLFLAGVGAEEPPVCAVPLLYSPPQQACVYFLEATYMPPVIDYLISS